MLTVKVYWKPTGLLPPFGEGSQGSRGLRPHSWVLLLPLVLWVVDPRPLEIDQGS